MFYFLSNLAPPPINILPLSIQKLFRFAGYPLIISIELVGFNLFNDRHEQVSVGSHELLSRTSTVSTLALNWAVASAIKYYLPAQ